MPHRARVFWWSSDEFHFKPLLVEFCLAMGAEPALRQAVLSGSKKRPRFQALHRSKKRNGSRELTCITAKKLELLINLVVIEVGLASRTERVTDLGGEPVCNLRPDSAVVGLSKELFFSMTRH